MQLKSTLAVSTALAALLFGTAAQAAPIDVSYATTGSSGNYTLNFSVTNNLGGSNDVYFFGVKLSQPGITGSPSGAWDSTLWPNWDNTAYGGSNTNYNNNWIDFSFGNLLPGNTLGGFQVTVADLVAPGAVEWFAYASGGIWNGGGNFNGIGNPGFEGTVGNVNQVPEPGSLALAGLGLVALALRKRAMVGAK